MKAGACRRAYRKTKIFCDRLLRQPPSSTPTLLGAVSQNLGDLRMHAG